MPWAFITSPVLLLGPWRGAPPSSFITTRSLTALRSEHQELHATYASLLRSVKELSQGQHVQALIKKDGLEDDAFLTSLLIQMYGKCGCVSEACQLFDVMPERPMLAWKSLIRASVQYGQCVEALQLYEQLMQEGSLPDRFIFVSILTACANLPELASGKRIHALATGNGLVYDITVETALVNLYGKCDSLIHGMEIFEGMSERTVILWNILIAAQVKHEKADKTFFLFNQMQQEGVLPNRITYINSLCACVTMGYADKKVHTRTCTHEFQGDLIIGNTIVNMYGRVGLITDASLAFDSILTPTMVSWTSLLEAYTHEGKRKEALQVFENMQQQGALPDRPPYLGILETCADSTALCDGKKMHACLVGMEQESSIVVGTAILQMYRKCKSLELAGMVFDAMPQHNLMSWTSMIVALAQEIGQGPLQIFCQMLQEGFMPDKVVFFSLIDVCCGRMALLEGKRVHACLFGGCNLDDNAGASLVNLYLKCSSLEEAWRLFDIVSELGVASWRSMIWACTEQGKEVDAMQLYCRMQQEGFIPDELAFVSLLQACANMTSFTNGLHLHIQIVSKYKEIISACLGTALVLMYGNCGDLKEAQATFESISQHNIISWTTLLTCYVQHGESLKAFKIFEQFSGRNHVLDDITFLQLLLACCRTGFVEEGCVCFLDMALSYGLQPGLNHFCSMIDLLGRAGLLDEAEALILGMPRQPSPPLWMTFLGACLCHMDIERGRHGGKHVFELNQEKEGLYVVLSNMYALADVDDDMG